MGNSKQQAIIAVAATIVLSGCGLIKPRDAGYFRFHAEEARLVVTRCERGQETGSDCEARRKPCRARRGGGRRWTLKRATFARPMNQITITGEES
jgi:hypothetical protein